MTRTLALVLAVASTAAWAADLSPDKAAQVSRDRQKAMDEVNKKYGNKKSSELSSDERRQMIRDQNEAMSRVLDKNGVDAKDFARWEAKASGSDRAAAKEASDALDKRDEDAKKAGAAKGVGPQPNEHGVIIEKGGKGKPPEPEYYDPNDPRAYDPNDPKNILPTVEDMAKVRKESFGKGKAGKKRK